MVATLADVTRLAGGLPEVVEGERRGTLIWDVAGKTFAWERPFSKADVKRYGDAPPPDGPILAVRVADLGEKEILLRDDRGVFFTTPHWNGYSAVLMRIPDLARIDRDELRDLIAEAWLTRAQKRVTKAWLDEQGIDEG